MYTPDIETEQSDLIYTHRVINYIQASFQGRFAMLNIFSQTGHRLFNQAEVEKTQRILKTIRSWEQELLNRRLIFPISQIGNPQNEHKEALEYLRSIKPELESLAKKVKEILTSESMMVEIQDAFLTLAAYGRFAYCRDNYVRGFIRFGEKIGDEYLKGNFTFYLEEAKESIETINSLLALLKRNDNQLATQELQFLSFNVRTLAGTFRSHVHDITQLLFGPAVELSYEKAGFFRAEAEAWSMAGYHAIEAGYWRAHEISISEAEEWRAYDLVDPTLVAEWKSAGFPAEVAAEWIAVLFQPILAIRWANQGFSPREAAALVMSGFEVPSEIPEDQVQEVIEEAFKRLADIEAGLDSAANS